MFNGIVSRMLETLKHVLMNERGEVSLGGDETLGEGTEGGEEIDPNPTHEEGQPAEGEEGAPAEEGSETPAEEPDPRDARIEALEAQIKEFGEKLTPKGSEIKEPQTPQPQQMTEEQWTQAERAWGIARNKSKNPDTGADEESVAIDPRKLLMSISNAMDSVFARAQKYTDEMVHGNVADIRFDTLLSSMEKKSNMADIRQFSEGIREYLKKRYSPKDWSNEQFIEDGLFWAKGKNLKNAVKKAVANTERNKKIVKPAGSVNSPAPKGGKLSPATMSIDQRRLAEKTFRDLPKEQAWKKYCELF